MNGRRWTITNLIERVGTDCKSAAMTRFTVIRRSPFHRLQTHEHSVHTLVSHDCCQVSFAAAPLKLQDQDLGLKLQHQTAGLAERQDPTKTAQARARTLLRKI